MAQTSAERSLSVVLATDQPAISVSNMPASLGQATMAASSPVVIASDQTPLLPGTGATNLGKAEDAAHASGDVGVMALAVRNTGAATLAGTTLDYSPIGVVANGAVLVAGNAVLANVNQANALTLLYDINAIGRPTGVANFRWVGTELELERSAGIGAQVALAAATAETTIWTPAASKKFRLMGFVLTASAQTVLTFKDNTGGTVFLAVELAANVPLAFTLPGNGRLSAAANNVLTVTRATSAILNGTLFGCEE